MQGERYDLIQGSNIHGSGILGKQRHHHTTDLSYTLGLMCYISQEAQWTSEYAWIQGTWTRLSSVSATTIEEITHELAGAVAFMKANALKVFL